MKSVSFLQFFVAAILTFSSCRDKEQQYLLQETTKRLEQQNEIAQDKNHSLRSALDILLYDEYSDEKFQYLRKYSDSLYKSADLFSEEIAAEKAGLEINKDKLFSKYTEFQHRYQQLKTIVTDSFKDVRNRDTSSFMKLDKETLFQKYLTLSDSSDLQIKLTLLQADATLGENIFLENILYSLTPIPSCGSMFLRAIATTEKCIYKKGERLKVTALLGSYINKRSEEANFDGQIVKVENGIFNYSRIVTESPGTYRIPIEITINKNGRKETYPAEVNFTVQ